MRRVYDSLIQWGASGGMVVSLTAAPYLASTELDWMLSSMKPDDKALFLWALRLYYRLALEAQQDGS